MKICPRCQKTYTDDNLNFCLEDGTTLQQMAASAPPPTVQMNPPATNPNAPGQPAWNTPQQYGGQQAPKKSKAWLWVLLILGLLIVVCGGGFGLLAYIGYKSEQANTNRTFIPTTTNTNKTSTFANKAATNTSSSSSNSSTTSTSSRSDETDLDLNMFVQKFSIYGNTEIESDELMVKANSGIAYYVLAAPDDYTSEDADTRLTLRNTTGGPCARGYGLVFHSNPTPLQQGYAFLIDTKRGKYAVVHHEPGKEASVVGWTSSTAINSGTAENTLEIRDHDKTVDLYINDTKVNSITNTYGYAGGVPGIYVGQGVKVAFKDFQIRK